MAATPSAELAVSPHAQVVDDRVHSWGGPGHALRRATLLPRMHRAAQLDRRAVDINVNVLGLACRLACQGLLDLDPCLWAPHAT